MPSNIVRSAPPQNASFADVTTAPLTSFSVATRSTMPDNSSIAAMLMTFIDLSGMSQVTSAVPSASMSNLKSLMGRAFPLHLSHRERSTRAAHRVRGYGITESVSPSPQPPPQRGEGARLHSWRVNSKSCVRLARPMRIFESVVAAIGDEIDVGIMRAFARRARADLEIERVG